METRKALLKQKTVACVHRDELNLSACSPPAALAVNASRLSWAVQQAALDTKQKIDERMPKMESEDNSGGTFQDPTDPTKVRPFFYHRQVIFHEASLIIAFC